MGIFIMSASNNPLIRINSLVIKGLFEGDIIKIPMTEELNVRHFMSTILIPRFSVQVLVDISSQQTCCSNQIEDHIESNSNIKQILVIFG